MRTYLLTLIASFLMFSPFWAQDGEDVWLHPNRGQWDARILYKVELNNGSFYLEKDRFTFDLHNLSELEHHHHDGDQHKHEDKIKRHTIQNIFEGSEWNGDFQEGKRSSFYRNYYISNDTTRWASKVHAVKKVVLEDFYDGIDLLVEGAKGVLKYSFLVDPGVDPSIIEMNFIGADSISYAQNKGLIHTRFGAIQDNDLRVWTIDDKNEKYAIKSSFNQAGNKVKFTLEEYDHSHQLVIDPSLTFSTFTGSSSDNWGFTAAPDNNGNLFAGGTVFAAGYPITTGAYDASFGGGEGNFNIDVGITKFNSTGTNLIYSTYLGAFRNEAPNSIVCNDQGELYILGVTSSQTFPTTAGALQNSFNGGPVTVQNALQFSGTDIFVSRLSADGTALLSSTYYGGSSLDGFNISSLHYNYGDQFRGEIIVDQNGDVLISSSTQSADISIVNGFDNTLNGPQDGLAAKMSPDLTTLIWSTYIGGSGEDASYAVQTSSSGDVYIAGGTASSNFPISSGQTPNFVGGISDGYILRLSGTNGANLGGTFVATPSYDQCYFVQLDQSDEVYVFGQSDGPMPISSGVYNNPNSGQFIQKFTTDLSTRLWGTVVGGGNNTIEISPTAFLVSDCYEIYYAGWGGQTNQSSQASNSTSVGLPTTPDAYQSNTNGNNFYVAVLDENAIQLNYATFMGGVNSSANHVDGGTSRFDKKGRIYHAVCGGCGGNANGFTTTPGVWSPTNQSSNCNLAAWKFDLGIIESTISSPDPFVCIPDSVDFINDSQNGNEYFWDFGDGNTSTLFEPSHFYDTPGSYEVTFVVSDTNGCYESDTSYIQIDIGEFQGAVVDPPSPICPGDPYQLEASGGSVYQWSPAQFLDDTTSATPTAIVDTTTTFTVIISDTCGVDTLTVTLETYGGNADATNDLLICRGDTVTLWATGGVDYSWSDPADIFDVVSPDTVIVAPEFNTEYSVEIYTAEGCTLVETIFIEVFQDVPQPVIEDTVPVCRGESVQVTVSGSPEFSWSPNIDINTTTGPTVIISTDEDRWYYVDFTNPCGSVPDSTFIDVIEVDAQAGNDTIVCPGDPVNLWATGGVQYVWEPAASVASPFDSVTTAQPQYPTVYTVQVTDQYGCVDSAFVDIDHFPLPFVQASPDYYGFPGDEIDLSAEGNDANGTYTWTPGEYLSCVNCQYPIATPPESITYEVIYIDENGCRASDDVSIIFEGIIYVPNTFTPNGDGFNELFFVRGGNIVFFEMLIFNRWGEVVFETDDFEGTWDGTYNGEKCKDGTYVWKIRYEDTAGNREEIVGHVNLLR